MEAENVVKILYKCVSSYHYSADSFLVLFMVTLATFFFSYLTLFAVWQGTFKSDWFKLYTLNVALARKFNELQLLVRVVFHHPPGPAWRPSQEKAQPLKLFFTDQSKVSTSAGAENSVIQILGSLFDSIEASYGTFATRLYRAFRPRPVQSSAPLSLRKLCCLPYAALYLLTYLLFLAEVVLITLQTDDRYTDRSAIPSGNLTTAAAATGPETDMASLVFSFLVILATVLGLLFTANIYTIGRTFNSLLFSQRTHLQRAVARHDIVQSEGETWITLQFYSCYH